LWWWSRVGWLWGVPGGVDAAAGASGARWVCSCGGQLDVYLDPVRGGVAHNPRWSPIRRQWGRGDGRQEGRSVTHGQGPYTNHAESVAQSTAIAVRLPLQCIRRCALRRCLDALQHRRCQPPPAPQGCTLSPPLKFTHQSSLYLSLRSHSKFVTCVRQSYVPDAVFLVAKDITLFLSPQQFDLRIPCNSLDW
jgi:hypothetical protein